MEILSRSLIKKSVLLYAGIQIETKGFTLEHLITIKASKMQHGQSGITRQLLQPTCELAAELKISQVAYCSIA
jgi:hypothetical protein